MRVHHRACSVGDLKSVARCCSTQRRPMRTRSDVLTPTSSASSSSSRLFCAGNRMSKRAAFFVMPHNSTRTVRPHNAPALDRVVLERRSLGIRDSDLRSKAICPGVRHPHPGLFGPIAGTEPTISRSTSTQNTLAIGMVERDYLYILSEYLAQSRRKMAEPNAAQSSSGWPVVRVARRWPAMSRISGAKPERLGGPANDFEAGACVV